MRDNTKKETSGCENEKECGGKSASSNDETIEKHFYLNFYWIRVIWIWYIYFPSSFNGN